MPSQIGERAEAAAMAALAAAMAALAAAGKEVLPPLGRRRYDLAYDDDGQLVELQCKAGLLKDGALSFRTHSVGRGFIRDHRGVSYFGVYCHQHREVYLVPIEEVPHLAGLSRLTPARNGQRTGIRLASESMLKPLPPVEASPNIDDYRYYGEDDPMKATAVDLPVLCCSPLTGASIDGDQAATTAALFKALSDPHRVRIVNLLANAGEAVCVCDITDAIGLSQPTVSFHLKKLVSSGLLHREKRATWAYYSLNREALDRLANVVEVKGNGA